MSDSPSKCLFGRVCVRPDLPSIRCHFIRSILVTRSLRNSSGSFLKVARMSLASTPKKSRSLSSGLQHKREFKQVYFG